jgi:hypothetical protein
VVALACIGKGNKHMNVLMHTGHMESLNLVASCVDELDDTSLWMLYGIVSGHPRCVH